MIYRADVKRVFSVLFAFSIVIFFEFFVYTVSGLYAVHLGCERISADCYIDSARLPKTIQAVCVGSFLLTLLVLAIYLLVVLWRAIRSR